MPAALATGLGDVSAPSRRPNYGAILFYGFTASTLVWCGWFVTHLPWLNIPEQASLPILLGLWLAAMLWAGREIGPGAWKHGAAAGLVSAIPGLLILGSKLAQPAADGSPMAAESLKPGSGLIALGFLALGTVIGLVGGSVGSLFARSPRPHDYLARFAVLTALAVAPLLFVGGLVTSTDSGMAVPDWPNTYGSNMFLYPLGPRVASDIYFEHSHRLFGTLVGLMSIVLLVCVLRADRRRWVRGLAATAFALVALQGVLGGQRVIQDDRVMAMIHGVSAQLIFGVLVALAIVLTPTFRQSPFTGQVEGGRPARFWTTGLLHSLILQLVFGAMYRHFRAPHALWTHAGFAIVVVIFAMAAGFVLIARAERGGRIDLVLARTGRWLLAVVAIQFTLGWAAFGLSTPAQQAATPAEALIRTAHQANGALLIAVATLAFVWTRRLNAPARPSADAALQAG